jgi:hypothetical protein
VRRSIPILVVVLAALAASTAGAKGPVPRPPDGAYDLYPVRTTYSGPPTAVRAALAKLINRRVTFASTCGVASCFVDVTVTTPAGRRVKFQVSSTSTPPYTGSVPIATNLRCGGRRLIALLTMTARVPEVQEEPGRALTGSTRATIDNPGRCKLFRGRARAVRRTWFNGVAVNG